MKKALFVSIALLGAQCFPVPVTPAKASPFTFGPIVHGEAWYCPTGGWHPSCYMRGFAKQQVCDLATGACWINSWWL